MALELALARGAAVAAGSGGAAGAGAGVVVSEALVAGRGGNTAGVGGERWLGAAVEVHSIVRISGLASAGWI
jgi:hypothetical protein